MAQDSYTVVTTQSWGSRIGGSLKGILFGLILLVVGLVLLWWNEGRAVREARALEEGAGMVVTILADKVDSSYEGSLVHMIGEATTSETLRDDQFGVEAKGIKLRRVVEMYQWKEESHSETKEKLGGGAETVTTYTYSKDWAEGVTNSNSFKKPEGHQNPAQMAYQSQTQQAKKVTLGAFTLSPSLINGISKYQPVTLPAPPAVAPPASVAPAAPASVLAPPTSVTLAAPASVVAPKVATTQATTETDGPLLQVPPGGKVNGNEIYVGRNPANPEVGDIRIRFEMVPATQVSIVSQQQGNSFVPYKASNGNSVELLEYGAMPAAQMFQAAQDRNTMITWLARVGGFVLIFIALRMLVDVLRILAAVIPALGSVVGGALGLICGILALILSLLTIAVAWLFYRPLLGVGLIAVSIGLMFWLRKMAPAAPEAAPAAAPAGSGPPPPPM